MLNQSFTEQTIVVNEADTNLADLGKTAMTAFGEVSNPVIRAEMAAMDKEFAGRLHDEKLRQIDVETKQKLDAIQKERIENDRAKAIRTCGRVDRRHDRVATCR